MKFKGTKGKWTYRANGLTNSFDVEVKNSIEDTIARTNGSRHNSEANAKLIAAAPELLDALNTAINILDCKNGYHKKHDNLISIEEMKQAINKALGK